MLDKVNQNFETSTRRVFNKVNVAQIISEDNWDMFNNITMILESYLNRSCRGLSRTKNGAVSRGREKTEERVQMNLVGGCRFGHIPNTKKIAKAQPNKKLLLGPYPNLNAIRRN